MSNDSNVKCPNVKSLDPEARSFEILWCGRFSFLLLNINYHHPLISDINLLRFVTITIWCHSECFHSEIVKKTKKKKPFQTFKNTKFIEMNKSFWDEQIHTELCLSVCVSLRSKNIGSKKGFHLIGFFLKKTLTLTLIRFS